MLKNMFCALLFLSLCIHSHAENKPAADDNTLKIIMQQLSLNMQNISAAIAIEDWALVENNALQVAEHPGPSIAEKTRINHYMADNMPTFKSLDSNTRKAAKNLNQLAAKNDGYKVITAFAELQTTCLACHQEFRQGFQLQQALHPEK